MATNRLEDLWKSANDGASAPVAVLGARSGAEFEDLLDAWFLERRGRIEFELLADESRKVLARLLADEDLSNAGRRRVLRLLESIDRNLHELE